MQTIQENQSDLASLDLKRPALDLTVLSDEAQFQLRLCVQEFRSSGNRLAREVFSMTTQLSTMQEILGQQFFVFVDQELGLSRRTAMRQLQVHKVLKAHFSTDGRINVAEASNFTQRALSLLTERTDEAVIDELKQLASDGITISDTLVRKVIDEHGKSSHTEVAVAQAEMVTLTAKLGAAHENIETQRLRFQEQLRNSEEQLRRAEANAKVLEDELDEIKHAPTTVATERIHVPTLPPGFTDAEEAIAAKKFELATLNDSIIALNKNRVKAQEQLQDLTANAAEFLEMKGKVDELFVKFPKALIQSMASTDDKVHLAAAALGNAMIQFGSQLVSASAVQ
jgi:chromosome segregation ATPase